MINRFWINSMKNVPPARDSLLFIGVLEDIPDENFGLFLPNKRKLARGDMVFLGYILPFDPNDYRDKQKIREELGYKGEAPLIMVSAGGTNTGRLLIDLCAKTYPLLKKQIPDLRMVLVCGPKIDPMTIAEGDGLEVKGFVPELYRHMAASDLCICSGGGTTTLELTALQRPFLFFPLEKYSEQDDVANRCQRYGAGVRMTFSSTTPDILAQKVMENLGKPVNYPELPLGGEAKAAKIINDLLTGTKK
jgi:UDP-N-acetylglucosamine:LPS N-acetylglucosamine transferase